MTSTGGTTRNCVSCGRTIAWDANVCPYCGHDYRVQMAAQPQGGGVSTGMKIVLYILSFFIFILGIIIGVIFYSKGDPESKHVGKMCIILAILGVVVGIVCWAVIVAIAGLTFMGL
jgi:hypothetical protein